MPMDLGANGLKGNFMKISDFGQIEISVTPTAANKEVASVDIIAENRVEPLHMTTNKDETIDQFAMRIKSMMRALSNGLPRIPEGKEHPVEVPAAKTWEQQKAELKQKAGK